MHENKDGFIRKLNANIESILSKREGHEPLIKVEQSIDQLKADLKGLVNLKLRLYIMRRMSEYLGSWMNSGRRKCYLRKIWIKNPK
jgi:Ribonuclease G/E